MSFSAFLGLLVGTSTVGYVLYHQAERDVEALLAQPVWSQTGRVYSAPMELWPGMRLTAGEVASDLQAAGYARVRTVESTGDFKVSSSSILLRDDRGDHTIQFIDGEISAVSPGAMVRLKAVELAELRGSSGESRRPIALSDLPEHVYRTVLAMEDGRFFEHEGVDPVGITRAVLANMGAGRTTQGGSTLTQQLVKNLFLTSERTYQRKAREALLSVALENLHTKEKILELYLNEVYLGQVGGAGVAGLSSAARAYFGKTAERLEIGEAAVLAGIISAPNRYSPIRHPERAIERRDLVLDRMVALGWLTAEVATSEKEAPLSLAPSVMSWRSPWLVEAAIEQVEDVAESEGIVAGQGWAVHTTLQPGLQRIAEAAVTESAARIDADYPEASGAQIALVAVRASDGAVLAMVGGRDYIDSPFNRVTSANRQLGSTIKPLTYLAAVESDHNRTPGSIIEDAPLERQSGGKTWSPKNYDGRYKGEISLRYALAQSRNIPAILLAEAVGMPKLKRWWIDLGLDGATALPSAALGSFEATPLQLAGSYTVFPGAGTVSTPRFVSRAADSDGNTMQSNKPQLRQVASPEEAWLVRSMMESVIEEGTGRAVRRFGVEGTVAGKTGTTDDAHDAWFVGFVGDIVVAVWVGYDRGQDLGLTGGKGALPTWSRFVAWSGLSAPPVSPPKGLTTITLCSDTLLPASCGDCAATHTEHVFAGQEPECPAENPLRDAVSRMLEGLGEAENPAESGERRGLFGRRNN
ncbi:MAG: penicillin-binding protein 1B [Myxococcota bacterium]|jgi:penicillin-binding protein 1B